MNVKEHITAHQTPATEILTGADSKQLVYIAQLEDHDFVVQDQRYLHAGLNLQMGFSLVQAGVKAITEKKAASMVFRGDTPKWLIVTLRKDLVAAVDNMKHLCSLLPDWSIVDMIVLDPNDGALFDEGPRMLKDFPLNPAAIYRGDRKVVSVGMKTAWTPWVVRWTGTSAQSARQPEFRTMPLMATGQDPEECLYTDPEMPCTLIAIMAHTSWAGDLCKFLGKTKADLSETPGPDAKNTKVYFAELSCAEMCDVAAKFGHLPRFGVMSIPMYEGTAVDEKPEILEVYVTSAKRSEVAPYMFALLMNEVWNDGRLITDGDIAMQAVSYTKVRVGLTPQGRKLLMPLIPKFVDMGLSFKDEFSGEQLTQYDSDSDASSVMSEWGQVETCMLIGAPPYWKEAHVRSVLEATGQKDMLLNKLGWNVGEIRTASWRIQSPNAKNFVGKVLKNPNGRVLLVISTAEYKERKARRPKQTPAVRKADAPDTFREVPAPKPQATSLLPGSSGNRFTSVISFKKLKTGMDT
mmetsp:Transcript_25282/g.45705  ORF Transcript_25282/g.45705 Transcript_25282/m.45705 type:complete len:521 (-) Transcript_25282:5282-6844(-)